MGDQHSGLSSASTDFLRRLDLEKLYPYALVGIISLTLSIRLLGLDKGISLDEHATLQSIFSGDFPHMLQILRSDVWPPLYYMLLKLWSLIGGGEVSFRLLSVFFGVGLVIVAMEWMKRYSYLSSIITGIILATMPIMLQYSQEIRGYSLLLFTTALSFYFASLLIANPERISAYLGLAFFLTLSVSIHMIGVMLILPVWIFIITMIPNIKRIDLKNAIFTIAVPVMVFIFFRFFYLKTALFKDWWIPPVSFDLLVSIAQYISPTSASPLINLQGDSSLLGIYLNYLEALTIFVLFPIILLIFGDLRRSLPFLLAALVYFGQLVIYSIGVLPILWERTLLPGIVPLVGFISLQLATIRIRLLKVISIALIILLSLISTRSWLTYKAWQPVENWRGISKILEASWRPHDFVVVYPDFASGPVQYYFPALPAESITKVPYRIDGKSLIQLSQIGDEISGSGTKAPSTVFLIFRIDCRMIKDLGDCHKLIMVLRSILPKPAILHILVSWNRSDMGILFRGQMAREKVLAIFSEYFDQPSSYYDFGTFYWLKYEPES